MLVGLYHGASEGLIGSIIPCLGFRAFRVCGFSGFSLGSTLPGSNGLVNPSFFVASLLRISESCLECSLNGPSNPKPLSFAVSGRRARISETLLGVVHSGNPPVSAKSARHVASPGIPAVCQSLVYPKTLNPEP